jgi:hypothetical protein
MRDAKGGAHRRRAEESIYPSTEGTRRFADVLGEERAEGTQAFEADLETNFGDRQVFRREQLLGAFDAKGVRYSCGVNSNADRKLRRK